MRPAALIALTVTLPLMWTQPSAAAAPPPPVTGTSICTGSRMPNLLAVTRYNKLPMNAPTPYSSALHRVVRAKDTVRLLYATVCGLSPVDLTPPPSCPLDSEISYTLTFRHNVQQLLTVTALATGCQWLLVGIGLPTGPVYWLTPRFWRLLGEALHTKPRLLHAIERTAELHHILPGIMVPAVRPHAPASLISALLLVAFVLQTADAAHSRVVFHATGARASWMSHQFFWPGGRMQFRAAMNCSSLSGPPERSFRAALVGQRRVYEVSNTAGTGGASTVTERGQRVPAGPYRLRVETDCTWTRWSVTVSTMKS
jgi:hypothetical protein